MARLSQALHLRQLAQRLVASGSDAVHQPVVIFAALARLQRARPRLVASLRSSRGQLATQTLNHSKLKFWRGLAEPAQVLSSDLEELLQSLETTESWQQACASNAQHRSALAEQSWNYEARLNNVAELITRLKASVRAERRNKLIFWHHFDARGFVPQSWQTVLTALIQQGWVVVVSSSRLQESNKEALERAGCILSHRQNLGLCLGAYRDFCCLLNDQRSLRNQIQTLVLCNDSTLPLGGPNPFCLHAEQIHQTLEASGAKLMGLTDSVQTRAYHIQTYFLALNASLLQHPTWETFWFHLNPKGEKDDLIQRGEVGLSQWLLRHNIPLDAMYSLTSLLLESQTVLKALEQLDLRQPEQMNITLMCWEALLQAGCPVIKKQLLLEPPDFLPQSVPLAYLGRHLSAADQELSEDLSQLLQSRFLRPW